MIREIYEIDDICKLQDYLSGITDKDILRDALFEEFIRFSCYKNAVEWNKAVRLCECLAIVGWGDHEPLEAIRGCYFNSNPNTYFINRDNKPRFFDAVWTKRKDGVAIDFRSSTLHKSPDMETDDEITPVETIGEIQNFKLNSQRNWIPKNPVFITRGLANCYLNSKGVIDSLEKDLKPELNRRMRPELYGNAIDQIILNCSFSFFDNKHCKTNYIIADESLKLKEKDFYPALLEMYSEKEIDDNGYYLRNRFTYGPFISKTGTTRIVIVFEKEFSELPPMKQKKVMSGFFIHALNQCAKRLNKKIVYNFDLMIRDFSMILNEWCELDIR